MSSDEEDTDCPLCMEELDIADRNFRPCPCGYQICRFCWHHIKSNLNGRCPACRRLYSDQIVEFVPVSAEEIMRLKKEKKEKDRQTRDMRDPSRRQLSNVRVVQKNLVYVLGLGVKHAHIDNEMFKKYGKIDKVVISKRSAPTVSGSSSVGIYVTFTRKEDAGRAIEGINGMEHEGKSLRASYGTTKYCTYYLRHMSCPNPNCMYLHEPGDDVDSYNKDTPTVSAATATNIGKHASSNSTTTTNLPNKRIATAVKPTQSSSTTTTPRTWAPIPKVVPIPPVVVAAPAPDPVAAAVVPPVTDQPKQQPKQQPILEDLPYIPPDIDTPPSPPFKEITLKSSTKKGASTSASFSSKKPVIKKPKKVPTQKVEEETVVADEKPALPATASWAKQSPLPNHVDVITPANFGPSLSDALNAPQKPKHSPSLKVKKEKKNKGKMVRLEEFEEAEREAKMTASKPFVISKPVVNDEPVPEHTVEEEVVAPVITATVTEEAQVVKEQEKEAVVADEPIVTNKDDVIPQDILPESIIEEAIVVEEKKQEELIDHVIANNDEPKEEEITPEEVITPVPASIQDESEEEEEEEILKPMPEMIEIKKHEKEDLATLNNDILKAFESDEKKQEEPEETPMAAMDRLSQLVQQELMIDSPQQQMQLPHPPPGLFNAPMNVAPHPPMPPPFNSFDPFNGQDPSLIAARRLQHSQRMLEASGLFNGFHPNPPPPPPPPFGFSPHPPPPMFNPMFNQPPMMMQQQFMEGQSRENFRALLPNVNISFNEEKRRQQEHEFFQQQQFLRHQQQQQQQQWQPPPPQQDVRVEAQNFFGEFLRKANQQPTTPPIVEPISVTPSQKEEEENQSNNSLPFQDPAIMSVRLNNEMMRSSQQNAILQILGGQQLPPPPPPQMSMEQQHHLQFMRQQQMDPRLVDPRMNDPRINNNIDPRLNDPRFANGTNNLNGPRFGNNSPMDPRLGNSSQMDPRLNNNNSPMDPRVGNNSPVGFNNNGFNNDPRFGGGNAMMENKQLDPRYGDGFGNSMMNLNDTRQMDPRFNNNMFNNSNMDPRFMNQRDNRMPPPPGMMRPPMMRPAQQQFRPPGMFNQEQH